MRQLILCPAPKELAVDEKRFFSLHEELRISVSNSSLLPAVSTAMGYFSEPYQFYSNDEDCLDICISLLNTIGEEAYSLSIGQDGISIYAGGRAGAFYSLMTLHQIYAQRGKKLPYLTIHDAPHFKIRGFMLDISRDKIPTLETMKERVDDLCALKINHLQLYFEGAPFEYKDYPDMWQGFDVLRGEEIRELDAYCRARFVELIPAQNTFGHMGLWLFDGGYEELAECPHGFVNPKNNSFCPWPMCLDPNDPKAFQLVRNISDDLLSWFSSDKFNVCCDETIELGWGKSKALCDEKGIGRVYFDYLMKLYAYCREKDKTMLFWADIINEYPEIVAELPRDVLVMNWGYYDGLPKEESCANFEKNGISYCVCPGTAAWNTQIGNIPQMLENTRTTIFKGYRHNALGVVNTEWGDGGHWQGSYSAYPGIVYGAAMSWQPVINENLDIAQALDMIFGDRNGKIGKVFLEAGRFMEHEGVAFENTSHALLLLKGSIDSYHLPENLTHKEFDAVTAYLTPLLERLEGAELSYADGDTVKAELRVGIQLILTAQNIGHYHLYKCEKNLKQARIYAKCIEDGLNSALTDLTKLWLRKNKLSKLYRAMAPLKQNLDAIGKVLHPDNRRP